MTRALKRVSWFARLKRWSFAQQTRQPVRQVHGRLGEQLAASYLRKAGYRIEAANVRFRRGELDLVAHEGKTLCFIEVRSVSSSAFGTAAESVTPRKQHRIIRAAQHYLNRRKIPWEGDVRFDVVAIQHGQDGTPVIELFRGAFEAG